MSSSERRLLGKFGAERIDLALDFLLHIEQAASLGGAEEGDEFVRICVEAGDGVLVFGVECVEFFGGGEWEAVPRR